MLKESPGARTAYSSLCRRARYRVVGSVQGVGFRPFVNRLANDLGVTGWVKNDPKGVLVEVEGDGESIESFVTRISSDAPPLARVRSIKLEAEQDGEVPLHDAFRIVESDRDSETLTNVPADAHVCEDCREEMSDPSERRYRYPFINCTNCGPRYSLIQEMPYDRVSTTMSVFEMCEPCASEYHDVEDRRFHAQPIACPECGPSLSYYAADGTKIDEEDCVRRAISDLKAGKILAVKSVGGFHLAVDARNGEAVDRLRKRKKRDSKPFALMAKDVETIRKFCLVEPEEAAYLDEVARPIVVLRKRRAEDSEMAMPGNIAPHNPSLGVMLPSAPLHYLLVEDPDLPVLVMTSGNISGHPIVIDNDTALEQLGRIVDYILVHNRDIRTRVDDSLLRVSRCEAVRDPVITHFRRSRGFAPAPIHFETPLRSILAYGAELKTTIALSKQNAVYLSQHIGDLKNDSTFQSHQNCANHMMRLLDIKPEAIAIDQHPLFRSSQQARSEADVPVIEVQHHHAHQASCMMENDIDEPVIGAIFDGTGYGTDGTIWGGEFLLGGYTDFQRVGHLKPFHLLGGDEAVKNPFRVALSLLWESFGEEANALAGTLFPELSEFERGVFLRMAERRVNATTTTSAGRLFDGISSLMGICHTIEYEAQAAIELEGLLNRDFTLAEPLPYEIARTEDDGPLVVDYRPMVHEIVAAMTTGTVDRDLLSRRFHSTLVKAIVELCQDVADHSGISRVALSGGAFMNEFLLVNAIASLKSAGLEPIFHREVPPNDGGIALGQVAVASAKLQQQQG